MSNPLAVVALCEAVTGRKHVYGQYKCPCCHHKWNAVHPAEFKRIACKKCGELCPTNWRKRTVVAIAKAAIAKAEGE